MKLIENSIYYFICHDTGDVMKGTYSPRFRKNGDRITSRTVFSVEHTEYKEIEIHKFEQDKVDSLKPSEKYALGIHCLSTNHIALLNGETSFKHRFFLVFSSMEKAKLVAKKIVLPNLIFDQTEKVQEAQNKFTAEMTQLTLLDKKLNDLCSQ